MDPLIVSRHSFSPLIHYSKSEKRYTKDVISGKREIVQKDRPIKYASHRDACILSYYAHQINDLLEIYYKASGLDENVIAYRAIGRANYDFAADAFIFAKAHAPAVILAFDVTSFFDTLDHALLKTRFRALLGTSKLPDDWFKVFRFITQFHFVELDALKAHPDFGPRLKVRRHDRIASIEELKAAGIAFHPNPEFAKGHRRGIPQGTPISAAASNVYMMEFDKAARAYCDHIGALYRRYSDDILVICESKDAAAVKAEVIRLVGVEKLAIAAHKTEETKFGAGPSIPRTFKAAQYLGFTFDESGPAIRESSLARQWRKMRYAVRRARQSSKWRKKAGLSGKVHTKKLYRRFSLLKVHDGLSVRIIRNFSSYSRRSAAAFGGDEKISMQAKRFEKTALRAIAKLKTLI